MQIGRTTSAGLWRFSRDYGVAGSVVAKSANGKFSHPAYFLFGRSIELALKAFLVARGTSYSKLRGRDYGHDLKVLLREARRRRLGQFVKLSAADIRGIHQLNIEYSSKRLEYIVTGAFSVPNLLGVQLLAAGLVTSLERFCIEATYGKGFAPNNSFKPKPLRGSA